MTFTRKSSISNVDSEFGVRCFSPQRKISVASSTIIMKTVRTGKRHIKTDVISMIPKLSSSSPKSITTPTAQTTSSIATTTSISLSTSSYNLIPLKKRKYKIEEKSNSCTIAPTQVVQSLNQYQVSFVPTACNNRNSSSQRNKSKQHVVREQQLTPVSTPINYTTSNSLTTNFSSSLQPASVPSSDINSGQELLLTSIKKYLVYLPEKKQIYYQMFSVTVNNEMISTGFFKFDTPTFESIRQILNTICKLSQTEMFDMSDNIIFHQILTIPRFVFAYKFTTKDIDGNSIYLYKLLENDFNLKYFFNPLCKCGKKSIIFDFEYKKATFYVPPIHNDQLKNYQSLTKSASNVSFNAQNDIIQRCCSFEDKKSQIVLLLIKSFTNIYEVTRMGSNNDDFQIKFYLLKEFYL